ncbi:hypothetical protein CLV30_1287 [Haloactinopolyspora alba]|uniref:Rad52/22 family double-strand break repair protein n=1 Tax=Haloactinopolyspora alba TaxID=648780 RepID=A0A2P8DEV6_9ACTN|nr:hypothetical protein [Haloactinopolyspora alba]PSK95755.1 hypothetical protein CLV30_1287 [Haloactinopolyspora alba]
MSAETAQDATTEADPDTMKAEIGAALADEGTAALDSDRLRALRALREELPAHLISKKPVDAQKSGEKRRCTECQGFHAPASHLDYAGHAAITERLLEVDPFWTWEPVTDATLLAALPHEPGGMWIHLTVAGVTRLGYGDAQGKTGHNAVKETIGDALRNAAMRFGVGLALWHKGDLHADAEAAEREARRAEREAEEQKRRDEEEAAKLERAQTFADTAGALDLTDPNTRAALDEIRQDARNEGLLPITIRAGDNVGGLEPYLNYLTSQASQHLSTYEDAEAEHRSQAPPERDPA